MIHKKCFLNAGLIGSTLLKENDISFAHSSIVVFSQIDFTIGNNPYSLDITDYFAYLTRKHFLTLALACKTPPKLLFSIVYKRKQSSNPPVLVSLGFNRSSSDASYSSCPSGECRKYICR